MVYSQNHQQQICVASSCKYWQVPASTCIFVPVLDASIKHGINIRISWLYYPCLCVGYIGKSSIFCCNSLSSELAVPIRVHY